MIKPYRACQLQWPSWKVTGAGKWSCKTCNSVIFSLLSWLDSWNLVRLYFFERSVRASHCIWPSLKVKSSYANGNVGKHHRRHSLKQNNRYSLSNYACLDDLHPKSWPSVKVKVKFAIFSDILKNVSFCRQTWYFLFGQGCWTSSCQFICGVL